jgi:hypothetical protein
MPGRCVHVVNGYPRWPLPGALTASEPAPSKATMAQRTSTPHATRDHRPPWPAETRHVQLSRHAGLSFEQAAVVVISGPAAVQGLRAGRIEAGRKG